MASASPDVACIIPHEDHGRLQTLDRLPDKPLTSWLPLRRADPADVEDYRDIFFRERLAIVRLEDGFRTRDSDHLVDLKTSNGKQKLEARVEL